MRPDYAAWQQRSAEDLVEQYRLAYPDLPPYDLARFDGCTMAPNVANPCCLAHDLDYWYVTAYSKEKNARKTADKNLRKCICNMAKGERIFFRLPWHVRGWVAYIMVRLFGRHAVTKHKAP